MNSNASAALRTASWDQAEAGQRQKPARFLTAREFFRSPNGVGSAFPASRFLVDAVLAQADLSAARLVVEFGPGSGRFTRALLDRMPADSRLVAIDTSPRFIRHLQQMIPDSRLHAVTGSAAMIDAILQRLDLGTVDCIVTGIPFSTMPEDVASRIVDASADRLGQGGTLLAYQMRDTIEKLLARRFATVEASRSWANIPPCHIFRAAQPIA
jgi:phospholipid N-methyltransferase